MSDPPPATPAVSLRGVSKRYGANLVLDGVDLDVASHEVVGLIGPSGSGKSTLLRCINLLEPIEAGEVLLQGERINLAGVDVDRVRERIGIVFQSFNLFPHLDVLHNVTLAPVKVRGIAKTKAEADARELLDRFGLADKARVFPDRLSGGQQQRVAIVRALAMEPEVMLFDEITSALDPALVAEVLSCVRELAASGMTMVLATHEMGFCRDVADRVAFLSGGRLVEVAPPKEMFDAPSHPDTKAFLRTVIEAGRLAR